MSLKEKLVIGALAAGAVTPIVYYSYEFLVSSSFSDAYDNALLRWGDTDGDGFVDNVEKDAFDRELLKDKGVTLVAGNMPRYKGSGEEVDPSTVTKWIEEYSAMREKESAGNKLLAEAETVEDRIEFDTDLIFKTEE